ncbi:Aste57867_4087 [Aphanomyces stellatus]|uniref:Aste57867_4087 protein n=1 Tax=Aphanomyces stellatus TaxID=120398 RepID=A0A485KC71_9STRA|nr:hypothetical protein As57867_004076 [Aphanomyces stellatus]VFT81220.1 Aste57867_4087 [Aphanomyces stellatus]
MVSAYRAKVWDSSVRDYVALGNFMQNGASPRTLAAVKSAPPPTPIMTLDQLQSLLTKFLALLSTPKPPAVRLPKSVLGKDAMTVSGKKIPFTRSMSKVARNQIQPLPTISELVQAS